MRLTGFSVLFPSVTSEQAIIPQLTPHWYYSHLNTDNSGKPGLSISTSALCPQSITPSSKAPLAI
ncbi:hypothetical protein DY000_02041740 [Brassica cretica]|uniref:Uncharacterized protein n=1 Tax=Brassica cretica TaxID=69181 RepID=A0ABQ7BA73_BRACR|nr:hypothetical protein DY000_02041740 [Brassica cretica]